MTSKNPTVKVGLEVHRQLDTTHKLFCDCPTLLADEAPEVNILRKLRPTQSELGQIDQAALFEFHRGKSILYESDHKTSCLVEIDEEPPGRLNEEAVEVCLTASLFMNARPVDEVHVMRKIVIDGSNPTGFQRTCVVAMNGALEVDGKTIPIDQLSLEEDAARKTHQEKDTNGYRIDRLGIPLIEVTTAPVLNSPSEVEKVALAIGNILRATRKVKRGLGSVRQDLNVSIPNGALIEIKGVQELELLGKAIELEVARQTTLLEIKEELIRRAVTKDIIQQEFVVLNNVFQHTKARVLKDAITKQGVVLGTKLPRFAGLLRKELGTPGLRFGTELAGHAIFIAGVGGIFHSDELPAYGIVDSEITQVKQKLKVAQEDAFVIVADDPEKAKQALEAVIERATQALIGVPEETRNAMPDGSSRFIRPRPGAARMYPETDVPSIAISPQYIELLRAKLPETQDQLLKRLSESYALNQKLAKQLVDSEYLVLFERISTNTRIPASFIATMLTETFKSLERDGLPIHAIDNTKIESIFTLVENGKITKEIIPELLKWQTKNLTANPEEGIKMLGIKMLTETELEAIIERHIERNREIIVQRGSGAFASLMGSVMSEVRGSTDPKTVSQKLKERLARKTS